MCESIRGSEGDYDVHTPVIRPPSWGEQFEIMCDASDYAVGAVLGQRIDKLSHVIYYVSKTLNDT
jgi:hypothetical protein